MDRAIVGSAAFQYRKEIKESYYVQGGKNREEK